jgi:hypothetical protein
VLLQAIHYRYLEFEYLIVHCWLLGLLVIQIFNCAMLVSFMFFNYFRYCILDVYYS